MNKMLFVVAAMTLCLSEFAAAASPSCEAQAADQKLSVSAKNKFIRQCQKDAVEVASRTCDSEAAVQKLEGTARKKFVKKCVKNATASQRPTNTFPGVG